MSFFGPSKDEIWSQISRDIGGDFIDGGFWRGDALTYKHGEWQIVLDTYTVMINNVAHPYTRMRAPFVNRDGLHFKFTREGFFSSIGKFFGMQDIQIGDRYFDEEFIIQGNNEPRVRLLLKDKKLKALIRAQPSLHFEIKDDEGWFGADFPEGVDELYFTCSGILKDKAHLKALFELFVYTLDRLVEIDSASEADPNLKLK